MTEMQELARWKYYHDWEEAPGSDYYIGPEGNGSLDKAIAVRLSLENAIAVDAHNYRHSQAILTLERERDEAREANAALMRERAEIIKTKHEQIGKLQFDLQCVRELASDDAEEWRRSVAAAEAQVQALREALEQSCEHIDTLTELLKVIKESWIDYDHVFSIAVHEATDFLSTRAALRSEP